MGGEIIYKFQHFPWYAIVILYQDGEVDAIMIEKKKNHIEYFCELAKSSKRVQNICDGLRFDFTSIPVILTRFALQDAYVFLNFNIAQILVDENVVYKDLPGFKVYGRHCQSMVQWCHFNEIVTNYDLRKIAIQTLNHENKFQDLGNAWVDPEALLNYVKEEKKLIEKEDDLNDKYQRR